jgi:SAM-dependent methyltransferase
MHDVATVDSLAAQIQETAVWKAALTAVERLLATIPAGCSKDARKFLRLSLWLPAIVKRFLLLGLDRAAPATILDLGTGTGMFPFVCERGGHRAVGLDIPTRELPMPAREIFSVMPKAFRVPVVRTSIHPLTPLDITGRFDLITGFLVSFNGHKQRREWGVSEWRYFIDDMLSHVAPGGRLVLMLNSHVDRFGDKLIYYDRATKEYFESVGDLFGATLIVPSHRSKAASSRVVPEPREWHSQRELEARIIPAHWQP